MALELRRCPWRGVLVSFLPEGSEIGLLVVNLPLHTDMARCGAE